MILFKNQKGYSLTAAMISAAIAGTVFMMLTKVVVDSQKVVKGLEQDIRFNEIIEDIKFFASDSAGCARYLNGQRVDQNFVIENTDLTIKIGAGERYRGWQIKEFSVEEITPIPNPREAKVTLVAERVGDNFGVPEKYRTFLMNISTDPTDEVTVTSCSIKGDSGGPGGGGLDPASITPPSAPLLCGDGSSFTYPNRVGGGVLQYTPTRNYCEMWGAGSCVSTTEFTCPEGTMQATTYTNTTPTRGCTEYACYVQ